MHYRRDDERMKYDGKDKRAESRGPLASTFSLSFRKQQGALVYLKFTNQKPAISRGPSSSNVGSLPFHCSLSFPERQSALSHFSSWIFTSGRAAN